MIQHFSAPDGRRLAYRVEGAGPAVLCLAGLTRNMRDFEPLVGHLAGRHRVIRLDSRGRGASDYAERPLEEYSVPVEAQDAEALIDHLALDRVAIIGTSRGGILGIAMAAARREQVACLILNDVGAVIEGRGLLRILSYLGRPPKGDSFEAAAEALAEVHARDFPGVPLERWVVHARALYRDDAGRPALEYDHHLRAATAAAIDTELPTVTLWPLFEALQTTPVLVIRGANSDILSRDTVAEMAHRHPGLKQIEIADRGHAPFLDEPEAVVAIRDFLREHCR
ncbi:MAG: alpha/beta hydrolase [Pseudomonadota bacterium]